MEQSYRDLGYWVCASFQHLRPFSLNAENIDEFEVTMLSGDLALFLNALRGRGVLKEGELVRIAKAQKIGSHRLKTSIVPTLSKLRSDRIVVTSGKQLFLEEHLDSAAHLYDVVGQVWEMLEPSLVERAAIYVLQHTFVMPRMQSEEIALLNKSGLGDEDAEEGLGVAKSFRIIQPFSGKGLDEPILFNPYIWRANQHKIARAVSQLPPGEKKAVENTLESVAKWQALPLGAVRIGDDLLATAHSVGLIDLVEVNTGTGDKKNFVFTPHLTTHPDVTRLADDLLNDVRAVLACVSYGEHYSRISRLGGSGREKTINTLRKLLRMGEAGDATAIGVDYSLLEERGIIIAKPTSTPPGGRYSMELLREEPVRIALRVIEDSVRSASPAPLFVHTKNLDPATLFASPEQTRVAAAPSLGTQPLQVKEARNHFLKKIRKEVF